MDFMTGGLQRHRKVFWVLGCGETPWWESSDSQKPLEAVTDVLSWKNWWIFAFRKWFCMEKFWKRRQDLSLPKVLLSHAGLWCWDGSQVFGLKPPTKVTVCTVCHNIMCTVPGTGFVTNWVMVRECPDPVSLIFLFKGPPATKALKNAWQRGSKSHRLSRHCWFGEYLVLHFSSHMGCFSHCIRLIPALCYLDSISHSHNCCSASTAVISAAKPLALPGFNLPIHFPVSNHKGPSSWRTVLSSLCYCLFCSWIFPWCFPGSLCLRHNTETCNAMCSLLINIDWCWEECWM